MPDRKTVKFDNGDRVGIYRPTCPPTRAMRERHAQLVEQAERRQQKRQWQDRPEPPKKFWWELLAALALVILL